jgi:hypothetical protein
MFRYQYLSDQGDREFNELVNMSADELKEWLKGEDSAGSGWSKNDDSGETIGHERYFCPIVELLSTH